MFVGDVPAERTRLQTRRCGQLDAMVRIAEEESRRIGHLPCWAFSHSRRMTALFSRPPMTPVLFLPIFSMQSSGCSFSGFSETSCGILLSRVPGSPQPTEPIMQQKTQTIEAARCRMARDMGGRDEITERFPLGCSDGPGKYAGVNPI